ncbi:MAG TPA: DUF1444 family protein [Polyangium sp.]|nr:DUF1444 family protein [Polyangium sp.]
MNCTMKLRSYKAVPEWARFLTLSEFRLFMKTVENELRKRRLFFEDHDGVVHILVEKGTLQCGLYNLAFKCASVKTTAYAREVNAHFERILKGHEPESQQFPATFDEVREYVRVRVYPNESVTESKAEVVSQQITPDLQALVVYDLGSAAASMSPEHLERWKLSREEVFRVAMENTNKLSWSRANFELHRGDAFALLETDGYAASYVLELDKHLPRSPHGSIVAMPCRQVLICYPIVPSTLMNVVTELTVRVDKIYTEPPGGGENHRLSKDLYWWKEGKLQSLGAGVNRLGIAGCVIMPPQEFVDTVMVEAMRAAAIMQP